jgi:hypothetical protein
MVGRWSRILAALAVLVGVLPMEGRAQPLGGFSFQLAPYCNVVTLSVRQDGSVYTLDGYDNQCGASARASASGMAFLNPNGTIGIGLTIVLPPGGSSVHVDASINPSTLAGTWSDDHGNTGAFVFTASGAASGSPRPLSAGGIPDAAITEAKLADGAVTSGKIADGAIGSADVNPSQVQLRVQAACPTGQLMTAVNENGTVACEAISSGSGGDITEVTAGSGLAGGGTTGAVTLRALFSGSGTSNASARADHTHGVGGVTGASTAIGELAQGGAVGVQSDTTALGYRAGYAGGTRNTAVGSLALDADGVTTENVAVGYDALSSVATGASFNTAAGSGALASQATGQGNVAVGSQALNVLTGGTSNIAVGRNAGVTLETGDNNLYLASLGASTESNTIRIGALTHTRAFLTGVRGVTTTQNNAVNVVIDSSGQLGTVSSSRRTKFDIADLEAPVTEALHHLRPVQFRYQRAFADGSTPLQYGLIAEEVNEVLPGLVALGEDGTPETVKYHVLPSLLLADVQRLERQRQRLESQFARTVAGLEQRLDAQARTIETLRAELSSARVR